MENTKKLVEVLNAHRTFEIPPYQRPYAWGSREIRDLLQDLGDLPDGQEHFTGTLVLHRRDNDTVHVVDGQQRLATIVILLDRICRRLRTADDRERALEVEARSRLEREPPILKMFGSLDEELRGRVLTDHPDVGTPDSSGGRRLVAAREQIDAALGDEELLPGSATPDGLSAWAETILDRLVFAVVTVTDASEVGVIFETMNNRGRDLTELEKVKNFLLYVSSSVADVDDALDDEINTAWARIFRVLAQHNLVRRTAEDEFLRAHWLGTMDPAPHRWQQSTSVRTKFALSNYREDHRSLANLIRTYVQSMSGLITAFAEAEAPDDRSFADEPEADETRRLSRKLARLDAMSTFRPLLMVARQRAPLRYPDLVRFCEFYAYRVYRIAGWQTRSGQATFAQSAVHLWTSENPDAVFDEVIDNLGVDLVTRCPLERLRSHLLDRAVNWYASLTKLRHLLFEYEEDLLHGRPLPFDWDRDEHGYAPRTVEHILPQQPAKDGYAGFDGPTRGQLVNDLGNLCLTADNSALGNRPFAYKRELYRQGLEQERELAEVEDWTPQTLSDRRQRLVEFALRRWTLEGEADISAADVVPEELDQADLPAE